MKMIYKNYGFQLLIFTGMGILLLMMNSCKGPAYLSHSEERNLNKFITDSEVFNSGFTGFVITEAESGEVVYEKDSDKYFTPASNVKIFTLYTALEILDDSIPLFYYSQSGDTLRIRASGGPSLNSPHLPPEEKALELLSRVGLNHLEISYGNHRDYRFGPGWAWDDYIFNYQAERTPLSLFGNRVRLTFFPGDSIPAVFPDFFEKMVKFKQRDHPVPGRVYVGRSEFDNEFYYYSDGLHTDTIERYIPFIGDSLTVIKKWEYFTGLEVSWSDPGPDTGTHWKPIYSVQPDSIYRRMMWESDNYLAEQLLLTCAGVKLDTLKSTLVIDYVLDSLLANMPHEFNWWDGSGLSRYNLTTPANMVFILKKLYDREDREKVLSYFPAGGKSGNLKDSYSGTSEPYVYAKTGTLRNHHALSGYLVGASGKTYIFSFMNSQFPGSSALHRMEMERVLRFLNSYL
jgi:serine-type D-Ala-D-Ala carboxypeptidase/endopeptidase (penicillin-binding protein 4)